MIKVRMMDEKEKATWMYFRGIITFEEYLKRTY